MSSRIWSAVLVSATSLAIVLIVVAASPHTFFSNSYLVVATLLFAGSIAIVGFSARPQRSQGTDAGWIGTIGVSVFLSILCWIFGAVAVITAGVGAQRISAVSDVLVVLSALFSFGATILASRAITRINAGTDFKSAHLDWSDRLQSIANRSSDGTAMEKILGVAEQARYLSRDASRLGFPQNSLIENTIGALESAVSSGDEEQAVTIADLLAAQFQDRELAAKSARRKA